MASRFQNLRPGVLILALAISVFIWAVAQGTSSMHQSFDVPVELVGVEESLVVTDQSSDAINVRLRGSRAALRNLEPDQLKYRIDARGGKPGVAVYEVDVEAIEHPTGSTFVGYSPSRIQVRFEKRGRKAVGVRAEITGTPAPGFHVAGVEVEPPKVWLEGARSQVMRLGEVVTESIDISGLAASAKREVRLVLGGGTVWAEDSAPLQVEVRIEADPVPEPVPELEEPVAEEEV
jgi:YbbR domain-containing protein